jgi:APA family basic amino acid/polyamine antiporter
MRRQLLATKSIEQLCGHADASTDLKRTLGWPGLIALGIGAIIGAGLFVRTAAAAANNAGPAVTLGFVIAAVGCAFAGFCYAEFASMIPVAGSAYTYAYATLGELMAWIIGWDLVLEYALGAATVAIAWSEYANKLLEYFGASIPFEWCHSPFEVSHLAAGAAERGVMNVPAFSIVLLSSLLLMRGTRESSLVNAVIVVVKVAIVVLFIVCGWGFIDPAKHHPYIPPADTFVDAQGVAHHFGGALGVLGAGGVVFFAFIGFDAVSTAAQEARNPRRDLPIGILGSLAICTALYVAFAHVLTGLATVQDFRTLGKEASVAYAIATYMPGFGWLERFVTVAILGGFTSVILVFLLGQSRVFYSMSVDGLVPPLFSHVHPEYRTPYRSNLVFLVVVGTFAAFLPADIVGDMTSIGTLFAFILVCAGVWRLRATEPGIPRAFRTPFVPLVPILGIVVCAAMIFGLGWPNWLRLGAWMLIGLAIYFAYGRHHSKLAREANHPASIRAS